MKVLTYNVHGWQLPDGGPNVAAVAEVIASANPDVVGLNEVFHPHGSPAALAQLAERLGMVVAFGATEPAEPRPNHKPYGNAVLSRWPITAHAAHHLSPSTSYGKRGLFEARIALPSGRPLTVYVTHLDHRSEELRVAQWAAADAWLQRDRGRFHLVLGDFNALAAVDYQAPGAIERLSAYQRERGWPEPAFDLIARVLKSGYSDAYAASEAYRNLAPAVGATWPSSFPERRIDYIFLPSGSAGALRACAPLRDSQVASVSDHLPVLADIDV